MTVLERPASQGRQPAAPRFRPLIPDTAALRELSATPLIVGVFLGVVFGASSLYLVLKVGLTVSASIPVAVISLTLFRLLGRLGLRSASVLEHNIVQTAGSAGESIAFGIGVTMPAIMILGFDLEITRVMLVGMLGGLLGILMMIPLRRALIVQQHGVLKYPEGTACAEVLKAGATPAERAMAQADLAGTSGASASGAAESQSGAAAIFAGFGAGVVYKLAMEAFKLWKDTPEKIFGAPLAAGSLAAEISPELLGVGYIIGPKIASTMAAGGVLAYLVLIPAIAFFGSHASGIIAPGTTPIASMGPDEIRGAYVLLIGAGAVAVGGIISVFRSLPMIARGRGRGPERLAGAARRDAGARRAAAHRPGPLASTGRHRPHRPDGRHPFSPQPADEHPGRSHDRAVRVPLRHRLLPPHRRDRLVVQSDLRDDRRDASAHLPGVSGAGLDRADLLRHRALGGRDRLRGGLQRRHDLTGPQVGVPVGGDAACAADRHPGRRLRLSPHPRPDPAGSQRRRHRLCAGEDQLARHAGDGRHPPGRPPEGTPGEERRPGLPRPAEDGRRGRRTRPLPGRRHRDARLSGRPRDQRDSSHPTGRHDGEQVRRPQGDPDELHHQGHPQPAAAMDPGHPGRRHRRRPGDVRHRLPGLRGGGVPADFVIVADLHRRRGALAGGQASGAAVQGSRSDARRADRRDRQEPWRAGGFGLYRRRGHRRHRHRLRGRRVDRFQPAGDRDHDGAKSVLLRTLRGCARAAAVRGPGRGALYVRPAGARPSKRPGRPTSCGADRPWPTASSSEG